MRVGLLSDAHGNPTALKACLERLQDLQVECVYFLGDAVGYMPGESEVLDILRASGVHCLKGNHEAMLLGELPLAENKDSVYRIGRARARLSVDHLSFIAAWPDHKVVNIDGKRLLLVHGSPTDHLQGYVYADSDLSIFDGLEYDAVFMGHTHRPFVSLRGNVLVTNVGSCGLPRDQGNLLAFAVYDTRAHNCEVYRLHFDSQKAIESFGSEQIAKEVHQCLLRMPSSVPFGQSITDKGA
jgi:putative phosphoesterase